ncbi:MAG TPA: VirB4 family type IV secretion/conjugal transfer ATPase, partial [Sphingomicrobium sp.]|nr:VirB4 family type IV secretion/conjugal transfer ATPase [Sphingomicrobium sp.]
LAVCVHVVRRRESAYPDGAFRAAFARQLDARYRARMVGTDLYRNDLYLTLVWQPQRDVAAKASAFLSRLAKARRAGVEVDEDSLKRLEDVSRDVLAALERYSPRVLGLVDRGGIVFSEPMEMLQRLISGEHVDMPLVQGVIASALCLVRPIFGREAIELRGPGSSRFAGIFGLKEYPATTRPGMLNGILAAPFELTLSQSFGFMAKADAKVVMTRKQNQMVSANDRAASQIVDLDRALDDLESNRFVMGEHHLTAIVYAPDPKTLLDHMSVARSSLASGGAVIAREDLGLEAAFWSMLPGNFRHRARSGAITSRNFAAFAPFHTYPQGRANGNHWGPAVSLLKTASGSPYYFNFHHGDLGNTFVCGPSGSGKTVILNFMTAQLQKHDVQTVFFDKDRGAEIFIRAIGGSYLPLRNGVPTGCAPFKALDLTPKNRVFLGSLVRKLVGHATRPLSVAEERMIDEAIASLAQLPKDERSLGALSAFVDNTDPEGIGARLARWQVGGSLGWVFDNEVDAISLGAQAVGFDMTDFLDNPEIRTPLMMYLFERVENLIDGRRICIVIDEFWKALGDEAFQDLAQNKLKTIRKQNGLMLFATQSPRDAIRSPIAHTIIEQCPTQVFMPNPRGNAEDYVEGFKLTSKEFELISEDMTNESRRFLVKQGHNSVVVELNLSGFDDELAVLSGRTAALETLDRVRAVAGDNPDDWLSLFHKERRA